MMNLSTVSRYSRSWTSSRVTPEDIGELDHLLKVLTPGDFVWLVGWLSCAHKTRDYTCYHGDLGNHRQRIDVIAVPHAAAEDRVLNLYFEAGGGPDAANGAEGAAEHGRAGRQVVRARTALD